LDEKLKNNPKISIFWFTLKDFINLSLNLVFFCFTLVQEYTYILIIPILKFLCFGFWIYSKFGILLRFFDLFFVIFYMIFWQGFEVRREHRKAQLPYVCLPLECSKSRQAHVSCSRLQVEYPAHWPHGTVWDTRLRSFSFSSLSRSGCPFFWKVLTRYLKLR
jgi:hypothetical protein